MKILSSSPAETEITGYRIGRLLRPGGVVKLYGDLGAGKTTMVKGIARAFGINRNEVTSPSFTIITEYDSNPRFVHIDLYRIAGEGELDGIGIRDSLGSDSVAVVEWPERAEGELPPDALRVRIVPVGMQEREIEIEGADEQAWNNLQA